MINVSKCHFLRVSLTLFDVTDGRRLIESKQESGTTSVLFPVTNLKICWPRWHAEWQVSWLNLEYDLVQQSIFLRERVFS